MKKRRKGKGGVPCRETHFRHARSHARTGIQGPEDTPYAAGLFHLELEVSARYPFEPPKVRFLTPVFHPNVDDRGRICLDTLKPQPQGSWTPSLNIPTLLTTIRLLLAHPNADDGLEPEATELYKRDQGGFERRAREHTLQHATTTASAHARHQQQGGDSEDKMEGGSGAVAPPAPPPPPGEAAKKDENEDCEMRVAGDDDDSTSSATPASDNGAAAKLTMAGSGPKASPTAPQQPRQGSSGAEEERGWDSDVSICGDDAGDSSSSSSLSDDEGGDIDVSGREGKKGEVFVTDGEGMPPRKRARGSPS